MDVEPLKVTVTDLVGLSNSALLAQKHTVVALNGSPDCVDLVNDRKCPALDLEAEDFLANRAPDMTAATDADAASRDADPAVIDRPAHYGPKPRLLDGGGGEAVGAQDPRVHPGDTIVIKSALPVGFQPSLCTPRADLAVTSRDEIPGLRAVDHAVSETRKQIAFCDQPDLCKERRYSDMNGSNVLYFNPIYVNLANARHVAAGLRDAS